ncbi:MAG: GntR family transcriptional regulator [Pseudonocardia sp.]
MAKTSTGKHRPVIDELRHQISTGDLAPGDWLPSEGGLMNTYGVSCYGARETLKGLAADGLIVVVDGKGSYVRARHERARHHDTRGLLTTGGPSGAVGDTEFTDWTGVEDPITYRATASVDLALTLGIPEHTPLFGMDRLLTQPGGTTERPRRMLHRLTIPLSTCTRVPALAEDPFVTPDQLYAALRARASPSRSPSTSAPPHPHPTTSPASPSPTPPRY